MGADLYWLTKDIDEDNGRLAKRKLQKIIDIMDDDQPFKEYRIKKIVDEYNKEYKRI